MERVSLGAPAVADPSAQPRRQMVEACHGADPLAAAMPGAAEGLAQAGSTESRAGTQYPASSGAAA